MTPELMNIWVGLGVTIAGAMGGFIAVLIRQAVKDAEQTFAIKSLREALDQCNAELDKHKEANRLQHAELYTSRNTQDKALAELAVTMQMLLQRFDSFDRKIDGLVGLRGA